ncbi:MAG: PAS domain S-box protein [Elusimicrobiales bacterium]|nr:PAS domain S-box protein [Elusimicrobiales bacterium]
MANKGDILVVDDSAASLQLISSMLTGEGYSVRIVESGELALSAAEGQPPELILLDVRMPGLDGFEVFNRLKAKPKTSETPVIFLTGATDPDECVAGLKLGAVDFIAKSFDRESLLAKVRTHIELYRLRKKLEQQTVKYKTLFENSNDAIFVHGMVNSGEAGKFIEVNDIACSRLGYSREELLKLTPPGIDAPGMEEKHRAALEELARTGHAVFEIEHAGKDGRNMPVEISSRVFDYGGLPHVLSIARDIAERKRAEAALLAREKLACETNIAFSELLVNTELKTGNIGTSKSLLTETAARLAGVARASIWEYSADGRELRCLDLYESGPQKHSEGLVLSCVDYPRYFKSLQEKSHIAAADARTHPGTSEFTAGYLVPLGITSMLDGIIPGSAGLAGVFCLEHVGECREWLPEEENLLSTLSALTAMVFDVAKQKKAEAGHERLLKAIEQAGEVIVIADPEGTIQYVNPAFEKVTGYTRLEAIGNNPRILKSGQQDEDFYKNMWGKVTSGKTWEGRMVNKRKDGTLYTEEATISPVRDQQGRIVNYVAVKRDITEQLKLENRLRQSQKMETVGLLAGGVAHDFNNILSAIMCNAGFLAKDIAPGDPKHKDVKEIIIASERAAALTRQLLAFSRRQIMATRVVDINGLVGGMTRLLKRVIGEQTNVAVKLHPSPCTAIVDPGQIEQVIMNLALNARDAMNGGGTITLETEIINPPEEFFDTRPDLPKGPLVCMKVSDTGSGMSQEIKDHLFEPFFTTKEQGKGTGLGLSTAFGIVKQSCGDIEVKSEQGKGSVFTVYLPLVEAQPRGKDKDKDKDDRPLGKGHETVLFVEDEESLRRLGERILLTSGYKVLVATDGQAALKLMEERGKPVDLLMSDVVMPGMSGRELGLELARRKLVDRALYMSGYTDEAIVRHGVLEPGIAFIYKPYTVEALLKKLREALDGPAGQAKV